MSMGSEQSAANGTVPAEEEAVSNQTTSDADKETSSETVTESLPPSTVEPDATPAVTSAASDANTSEPDSSSTEKPRRRVQLNPSAAPDQFKAIPTAGVSSSQPVSAEQTAASEPVSSGESKKTSVPTPSVAPPTPVEIPPSGDELDAALEAEIDAALSNDQQSTESVLEQAVPTDGTNDEKPVEEELEEGTKLTGKVDSIHGDNVFVELGYRSSGLLQLRQFESTKQPIVGQDLRVVVNKVDAEEGLIICILPGGKHRVSGNWDEVAEGQVVDCMVTKTNKGGLEVTVGSLRGFLPAGQIDINYVSDMEPYVGQKLTVKIIEAKREKRNLVVSRRACIEVERAEAQEDIWKTLAVGQQFPGKIKTIKNYGAFVDIGNIDGFLHIGEISWTRINHPSELLKEGQQVDVQVISIDPEKKRIGLGMKQLAQNPWTDIEQKYQKGNNITGKVSRTADFGAFVELEPGIEGLVHISELDYRRINKVADVLNVGQEIEAQVLEVDADRKRISLSLKALQTKPVSKVPAKKSDEDLAPGGDEQYTRKRKGPLKGGTGESGPGGLFGNPTNFE